jgi:hypothetical protein
MKRVFGSLFVVLVCLSLRVLIRPEFPTGPACRRLVTARVDLHSPSQPCICTLSPDAKRNRHADRPNGLDPSFQPRSRLDARCLAGRSRNWPREPRSPLREWLTSSAVSGLLLPTTSRQSGQRSRTPEYRSPVSLIHRTGLRPVPRDVRTELDGWGWASDSPASGELHDCQGWIDTIGVILFDNYRLISAFGMDGKWV